ncbi:hypothetical protein FRACYDRAFT_235380 [Fragilariopsis cylindrus CCMP1102]|uniref:Uncharacterized protein n=1 Tax=Fragilariopsis cylindrus CCMP1102 TaxID=635003 RepID=A0A1E7FNG3_9STRA|nr:hypothetical protein FRACYDRAFT_235380 [Fragilariopsis cylindrus CCMP1102]|eukprot:OEU19333.1 hypothetical protein FRACYDRAFT_235380 [Fragilariopsis cylindrus CCMP1102]
MMNIDTSTSTFKNKDAVVVQHINHPPPPPPPPILARQQSDESYTPLPLSLSLSQPVDVAKKKQGQEEDLPRTTPATIANAYSKISLDCRSRAQTSCIRKSSRD